MKESEKRVPSSLDSIELDYTRTDSVIDQVEMAAAGQGGNGNNNSGDASGSADPDFMLGDMELIFDEEGRNNNSGTAAMDEDSGDDVVAEEGNNDNNNDHKRNSHNRTDGKSANEEHQALAVGSNDINGGFPTIVPSESNPQQRLSAISISSSLDDLGPRPAWHSDAEDMGARQNMILEIARLLKSRKKTQPSNEWLQQLPHKARKLEERLYRAAPSLSAYQDMSTLKNRLRKVAQMITKQYAAAKTRHHPSFFAAALGPARRNRRQSAASIGGSSTLSALSSSLRGSVASNSAVPSVLQRDSVTSYASIDSLSGLNQQMGITTVSAVPSQLGSAAASPTQEAGAVLMKTTLMDSSNNSGQTGAESSPSLEAKTAGESAAHHKQQQQQQEQTAALAVGNPASDPLGNSETAGNSSASLLEQQKAINEKLRLEIQENIRKQNEWFRQLQQQQPGSQQPDGATASNSALQMSQGSNFNASVVQSSNTAAGNSLAMNAMQGQMGGGNNQFGVTPTTGNMQQNAVMQQQMAAVQAGMATGMQQQSQQQQGSRQGMAGYQFGSASAAALMNNPNASPAARLQAAQMQAAMLQQQNPMAAAMFSSQSQIQQQQQQNAFSQQQGMAQGQQQQMAQQQRLDSMLRGPPVVPGNNSNAPNNSMPQPSVGSGIPGNPTSSDSSSPSSNGAMPPPPVVTKLKEEESKEGARRISGNLQQHQQAQDMGHPPLSPGSFNW